MGKDGGVMARVTLRYWAAAKAAAGTGQEQLEAATLDELVQRAGALHGPALRAVLSRCAFLVDGVRAHGHAPLESGATVEALPPFAGG
jgi:molybdopterin converting factor small subunit